MLHNAYLLAKIGADTAENERNFAKHWQLPCQMESPLWQTVGSAAPFAVGFVFADLPFNVLAGL